MLDPPQDDREALWRAALERVEHAATGLRARHVGASASREEAEAWAQDLDFSAARTPSEVLELLANGLEHGQVQTAHPRYFGLPQAAPAAVALVAGALADAYNPQLATRGHAPFAVALEDRLLQAFGERFGYAPGDTEGAFTSGGAEANATALQAALAHAFPEVAARGLRALAGDPTVYVSSEGHPTVARAARMAGLGADGVRVLPADAQGRLKIQALREAIGRDRAAGALPFLVVATAGTTSSGAIDPLAEMAELAARAKCWLHVDAAWGGMAALVPELTAHVGGLARADSIAFDPHKVLAVPLGTGMLVTRRRGALAHAFRERAAYMPRDASRDPYARSMTWSRRFAGAAVFAVLATAGWDGLAASLRAQVALADRLRAALVAGGWTIVNETPLPVVCFCDGTRPDGATPRFLEAVARAVIADGGGWLSVTRLASGARALRAGVTTHRTEAVDVDRLVQSLSAARAAIGSVSASP
jgi:glutamate/tyrosine decarboxylase-like PLP-dependent enzyme